jgi:hypothetical protein
MVADLPPPAQSDTLPTVTPFLVTRNRTPPAVARTEAHADLVQRAL